MNHRPENTKEQTVSGSRESLESILNHLIQGQRPPKALKRPGRQPGHPGVLATLTRRYR
ncbi:MAG: hypothetical protein AAGF98_00980 [Cyanobacteria bacterium P01_H01_bin.153]